MPRCLTRLILATPLAVVLVVVSFSACAQSPSPAEPAGVVTYHASGIVLGLDAATRTITIKHTAITNYMDAMTMPFHVKSTNVWAGLTPGQKVRFELHVTADTSWVDHIAPTGETVPLPAKTSADLPPPAHAPILDALFTNELGQPLTLASFHGQALAVTFFYTRCPVPDYCPRLSKNFQQAVLNLSAHSGLATNWHFLSITFDPEFDSPEMLKTYARTYAYDPAHWSFLTASPQVISELARQCGVSYEPDAGTINHNFRTLIVDPAGNLQMVFPTGGDLSGLITSEILKALGATNEVSSTK